MILLDTRFYLAVLSENIIDMSANVCLLLMALTSLHGYTAVLKCDFGGRCKCSFNEDGTLAAHCSNLKIGSLNMPKFYPNVTVIDLSKNVIRSLPEQGYLPSSVTRLDFSYNILTKFNHGTFKDMSKLQFLNLDENKLDYYPKIYERGIFENLTMLQTLRIKLNTQMGESTSIDVYPEAITELLSLEKLYSDGINGAVFPPTFRRLQKLRFLDLSGITGTGHCSIYHLQSNFFNSLPNLISVNLADCKLRSIELNTFTQLPMMQFLNLSHNTRLTFANARNITTDLQFTNITTLDISKIHCTYGVGTSLYIEDVEFLKNTSIRNLYVNSNRLTMIESGLTYTMPDTLEFLSLDDNRPTMGIYMLQLDGIKGVKAFSGNGQYTSHSPRAVSNRFVDCHDWRGPPTTGNIDRSSAALFERIHLSHRSRGRSMFNKEMKRYPSTRNFAQTQSVPTGEDSLSYQKVGISASDRRRAPSNNVPKPGTFMVNKTRKSSQLTYDLGRSPIDSDRGRSLMSFVAQTRNQTMCVKIGIEIIFNLPPNLENATFSNSDLKYSKIPCIHVSKTNVLKSLDFSDNGLRRWVGPIYNLDHLDYLDLSGNLCMYIGTNFFYGTPNITTLKLKNNLLGFVLFNDTRGQIFRNLKRLEKLDLSINKIEKLPSNVFAFLENLRLLDLSSNQIFELHLRIENMKHLEMLDMSKNALGYLGKHFRNNVTSIAKSGNLSINLLGNRLQCNCDTLDFLEWVFDKKYIFMHFDGYECTLSNTTVVRFKILDKVIAELQRNCSSRFGLILGISSAIALSISCVISGLVYRFRWKLRYLYYMTKYRNDSGKVPVTSADEYCYRAFLSYAEEDSDFVRKELVEQLENRHGIKLCIHQRDFIPGREIAENITSCIHQSSKFMVILSEHYLKSYWCMFEFNMARMESIYSRNGSNMVFIVLYRHVPPRDLPLDILAVVESKSYAEYLPEHETNLIFWDNLRCALNY